MNNRNSFKGTGKVFKFTLAQNIGAKGFKIVTLVVGLIAVAAMILINVIAAKDKSTDVKGVFIVDNSGLVGADADTLSKYDTQSIEGIEDVEFKYVDVTDKSSDEAKEELLKVISDEESAVGIYIDKNDKALKFSAYVDNNSGLSEDDGLEFVQYVSGYYSQLKFVNAQLNEQQLAVMLTPVEITDTKIGEQTSMTKTITNIFAPMVFAFTLYFMLLIYGQSISKTVIAEKTSKLMEYMLTSVKSEALIAGKILAMVTSAIIQVAIWVACIVAGAYAGEYVGKAMNPDYSNVVFGVLKAIKNDAKGAFTWYAIMLSIVAFIMGFFFYCVIAGLVASFVQKTESLAPVMVIYQYTVIAGFFVAYFGSFLEKKTLTTISNYVPLCSPFTLTANILIGALTPVQIAISLSILLVSIVVFVIITSRIYRALVLYNGAKVTPAVIKGALLGKVV